MDKKELPIGNDSFREVRESGYYVDKTAFVKLLIDKGKHNFLSRPRRFGKSLLVDTLQELFECEEELFKGLYIHDKWDWDVKYPVLRFSFGGGNFKQPGELQKSIFEQLTDLEDGFEVKQKHETASGRFGYLVKKLAREKGQRVVILVDEYDKPIFNTLGTPEIAEDNREILRGFYSTIKECNKDIRFSFLTGVTKFAHAGIHSGLNMLRDLTLKPEFSSICGYTDHDLDTVFASELVNYDREKIKKWYNGYNWCGPENVYNPFSILLLLDNGKFEDWWFRTGTPSFLIEVLKKRRTGTLGLTGLSEGNELISSIDIETIKTPALLFQTGYLTIVDEKEEGDKTLYRLDFPNHEVREGLHQKLIEALTPEAEGETRGQPTRLREALETGDFSVVREILQAHLAGLSHDSYRNNPIAEYEGHYSNVVYTCMGWTGLVVRPEDPTNHGNIDLTVETGARIVIFEFKVLKDNVEPGSALQQIRDKKYADKYRARGVPIHLVGVEFDPVDRNIKNFDIETI